MVTHSSVLAWKIPGTGSLVGCRLWGRTESDTTEATQQQQQTAAHQAFLSFTISRSLLKLMSMESVMLSSHLILCRCLLLLPLIFPRIRVIFNESAPRITWPKYWRFSFSISLSSEYSGFISFKIDWLDLLAVQGTLKSLLQHHNWKASILLCSVFFTVQLSYPYDSWKNYSFDYVHLCQQSGVSTF